MQNLIEELKKQGEGIVVLLGVNYLLLFIDKKHLQSHY